MLVGIDQRKRIELALAFAKQQAESATRAKSRFLATVTHELRTPLHAILGFAEVIGRLEAQAGEPDGDHPGAPHAEAAERRRDLLATIRRNGRQLLSLIDEVLDFSRLERGRLALRSHPTALPALLRDCVGDLGPLAAAKGLALHLDADTGLPPCVWLDGRRVRQVLTNLLGNALAHTQAGEVRLSAAATPDPAAAERYVTKPFDARELLLRVASHLRLARRVARLPERGPAAEPGPTDPTAALPDRPLAILLRARDHLLANLADPPDLAALARHCATNRTSLERLFKTHLDYLCCNRPTRNNR